MNYAEKKLIEKWNEDITHAIDLLHHPKYSIDRNIMELLENVSISMELMLSE